MKSFERGAGILLAISSLPSKYGIGTLGTEAYHFVDLLVDLHQKYWQVLPLGPTSFGDSPYQSFSAFAGNPYLIDLEALVQDGLLETSDIDRFLWGNEETEIDYAILYRNRFHVLRTAFERFDTKTDSFLTFMEENSFWLEDYSLFMALKGHFDQKEWQLWDEDIKNALDDEKGHYIDLLHEEMDFWNFLQYEFFTQWDKLKAYANARGVMIIGEVPLYVSCDSADVWAGRARFLLNADGYPDEVAGCPPDQYSSNGQKWGNPLYDWSVMEEEEYVWWYERIRMNARLYDVIRINHFVGIVKYYAVSASGTDGLNGKWYKGPGKALTDVIEAAAKDVLVTAEDFGTVVIPQVRKLMNKLEWPGMKVLLFAFDEDPSNLYLPHNYENGNTILYGTTHDSDTIDRKSVV